MTTLFVLALSIAVINCGMRARECFISFKKLRGPRRWPFLLGALILAIATIIVAFGGVGIVNFD
jgi:hypothetical protein